MNFQTNVDFSEIFPDSTKILEKWRGTKYKNAIKCLEIVVVGRLPTPVSLGIDGDSGVLSQQQFLGRELSSLQLDALRSQLQVPVEEDGAGLGRVVHILDELLKSLDNIAWKSGGKERNSVKCYH